MKCVIIHCKTRLHEGFLILGQNAFYRQNDREHYWEVHKIRICWQWKPSQIWVSLLVNNWRAHTEHKHVDPKVWKEGIVRTWKRQTDFAHMHMWCKWMWTQLLGLQLLKSYYFYSFSYLFFIYLAIFYLLSPAIFWATLEHIWISDMGSNYSTRMLPTASCLASKRNASCQEQLLEKTMLTALLSTTNPSHAYLLTWEICRSPH